MKAAARATRHDVVFPRAWLGDSLDFSFSGLKTAVRRTSGRGAAPRRGAAVTPQAARPGSRERSPVARGAVPQEPEPLHAAPSDQARVAELADGFQESVVDVLVTKTLRAARQAGARSVVLGGGVAANRVLRDRLADGARKPGFRSWSRGRRCARTTGP